MYLSPGKKAHLRNLVDKLFSCNELASCGAGATASASATTSDPAPDSPAPTCSCGSPWRWIDLYDGGPWCWQCDPPPSKSLVKRREYLFADDIPGWMTETEHDARRQLIDNPTPLFNPVIQTWAWLRRLFPDLDGEPGTYCVYCLSRDIYRSTDRRWRCKDCGRFVKFG